MHKTRFALMLFLLSIMATACVKPIILAPTNEEKSLSPTDPMKVVISTISKPERKYTELGYIFAQGEKLDGALKLAREEAAKVGGDGIIASRVQTQVVLSGFILFFPIYETYYYVRGTVVKYE